MFLAQSPNDLYYTTSVDSSTAAGIAIFSGVWLMFWLVIVAIMVVGLWKVFTKAGQPGWAAIVPIYNYYVLLQIAGRPAWWLLLYFIPFINFVVMIIVSLDIAKAFGKSEVFGVVALVLFAPVGYLILGFGSDKYIGATASKPEAQQ